MTDALVRIVDAWQGHPLAPVFFVAAFSVAILVLPVTIFEVVGGVLFGFRLGLALNIASVMLGTSLAFFLARRFGRVPLLKLLQKRGQRFARLVAKLDFHTMLIIRLLGFPPFWTQNYLAGLSNIGWRRYWAATFLGTLPWLLLITHLADTLWNVLRSAGMHGFNKALSHQSRPLAWSLVLLAGVVALTFYVKRQSKDEVDPQGP